MIDELSTKEKERMVFGIHDDEATAIYKTWTEDTARITAEGLGIKLTDDHWKVIRFLRLNYENGDHAKHARELAQVLNERFADEGGSRYLYRLFPQGPVSRGCRIAGVPVPKDATDASFGTSI